MARRTCSIIIAGPMIAVQVDAAAVDDMFKRVRDACECARGEELRGLWRWIVRDDNIHKDDRPPAFLCALSGAGA